jgi:PTH1 family peptidyl-tRNA hydrolase
VGRDAVLRLAHRHGLEFPRGQRFRAHLTDGPIAGRKRILALPETYMNRSGDSVGPMAGFYRFGPADVLVVHDELDLPLGAVRLKLGGGTGGHNGLRDVERGLGSRDFGRVRIGVGRPPPPVDPASYVLMRFREDERELVEDVLDRAVDAIERTLNEGMTAAMNEFNRREKQKDAT